MSDQAVGPIAEELAAATAAAKCGKCACFQDAVEALRDSALAPELADILVPARATFGEREYDCLGCKTCWPAVALNLAGELVEIPVGVGCAAERPPPQDGWPPFPGEYRVVRYSAPVAVCTLHSHALVEDVFAAAPEGLSLVGALQTENLGVERIVENVTANPNVRVLLLCGEDTAEAVGHFPGQALAALVAHGVDGNRCIVDARGKRPELHHVEPAVVERFRAQVHIVDHRGETDASRLSSLVEDAARRAPEPLADEPPTARRVRVVPATGPDRLVLDPAGYVVIVPDRRRGVLAAEHYGNDGVLRVVIEGGSATEVMATLLREELVSRLDHVAYLARELERAARALVAGTAPYVQDRAPEPDPPGGGCSTTCCGGGE